MVANIVFFIIGVITGIILLSVICCIFIDKGDK